MTDFQIAILLNRAKRKTQRRILLFVSLAVNLGILFLFKYFNFFLDNINHLIADAYFDPLNLIIPVGISFYTFQTLSYTIDVYRKKIVPTKDWVDFFAYVSFFPQLVAGPIERSTNLLPQFEVKRKINLSLVKDGLKQILWGLFKKVVIADNCAIFVNEIYGNHTEYNSYSLLLASILFSFQIYGDFSGYSDIAIGVAKLFGFNLKLNFNYPYFSRDIAEFWRRWHISLTTWFRDYVYIPLGGSRGTRTKTIQNIFIIFIISGIWHGANWTFIVWGLLNALLFIPKYFLNSNRTNLDNIVVSSSKENIIVFLHVLITFLIVTLLWVFFRAENIEMAITILSNIFSLSTIGASFINIDRVTFIILCCSIITMLIIEFTNRNNTYGLKELKLPKFIRYSIYYTISFFVINYFNSPQDFIYFQF